MVDKTAYPPLTDSEYVETFTRYIECSTEYDEYPRLIKQIDSFFQGRKLRVLSIGAGTGCVEGDMMKTNGLKMSSYYAIEPNEGFRVSLKKFVESWEDKVPYVIDPGFFTPDFKTEHQFDFVIMSHSLYGMPNWKETLKTIHTLMAPGGKFLLFHQGGEIELQIELCKHATISPPPIGNHLLTFIQIQDFLKEENIKNSLIFGPTKVLINDFYVNKEAINSTYIIDFLLQTWYKNLNKEHQEAVENLVTKLTLEDENGKKWLDHPVAMIIIDN